MEVNSKFLIAVATHEGFYKPRSVAKRYNNPGNLTIGVAKYYKRATGSWKNPKSGITFAIYEKVEDGWADLNDYFYETITDQWRNYRREASSRGKSSAKNLLLAEYFGVYAPIGWENILTGRHKPNVAYASSVSKNAGIPLNSTMGSLLSKPVDNNDKFLIQPIDKVYITQRFGERPEIYKQFGLKGHNGIDYRTKFIDSPLGKRYIVAAMAGKVIEIGNEGNGGYGVFVRIQHRGTEQTVYGHLKKAYVAKGQLVKQGETIGLSDNTGFSSGAHLHFSYRPDKWEKIYGNGFKGYVDQINFIKE